MTSRRSFLSKLALGVAGFTILPAATTYARSWKKTESIWVLNPEWVNAPLVSAWYKGSTFKEFQIKWDSPDPHQGLKLWTDHLEPKPFPKLNLK